MNRRDASDLAELGLLITAMTAAERNQQREGMSHARGKRHRSEATSLSLSHGLSADGAKLEGATVCYEDAEEAPKPRAGRWSGAAFWRGLTSWWQPLRAGSGRGALAVYRSLNVLLRRVAALWCRLFGH